MAEAKRHAPQGPVKADTMPCHAPQALPTADTEFTAWFNEWIAREYQSYLWWKRDYDARYGLNSGVHHG